MLTEGAVSGAGDALVEIPVSSSVDCGLGLENDLNMSDCSLFTTDGLLAGFFSASLRRSAWISGATAAGDIDLLGLSFDLTAFFCSLLIPWLLKLAFPLIVSAGTGGAPIGGRLPVLRYKSHRQGLEAFNG